MDKNDSELDGKIDRALNRRLESDKSNIPPRYEEQDSSNDTR